MKTGGFDNFSLKLIIIDVVILVGAFLVLRGL